MKDQIKTTKKTKTKKPSTETAEVTSVIPMDPAKDSSTEENKSLPTYVVVRDGYRVSEKEYLNKDDPNAVAEKEFWTKVENKHSWGAMVDIVPYDSKKHRVW